MTKQLTIAVSGLSRGENIQPGPAVINSIRRAYPAIKIVGLSYDPFESGLYSTHADHVDAAYLMPYPTKGPSILLERLDEIGKTCPLDMIVPCLDTEIPNYIELHTELKQRGIKLPLVTQTMFNRRDKQNLAKLGKAAKVRVPRTEIADTLEDLRDWWGAIGFPVFVKGKMYGGAKANTPMEAVQIYRSLIAAWGGPVIIQAAIDREDEYGVVGLGDGKGNIVGSCTVRKIVVTATGKTFGGLVVNNPHLDEYVQRIVKTLKWYGPFDLEFIKNDDGYFLIEMNPRFPAWVDFPSQIDCNLPAALVAMLHSDLPPPVIKPCAAGKLFMRHCYDLVGDISQIAAMTNTTGVKNVLAA
jgi:carbamoyl-phosphate synthase large subunit